jgi:hypothetical protein
MGHYTLDSAVEAAGRTEGKLCERMDARVGGTGVVGDEYGVPMGVRRPREVARLGLIGLGSGRVGTGLTGGGAFEQRRARRNLKGIAQETRLLSG